MTQAEGPAGAGVARMVDYMPAHLPELTDLWVEAWRRTMPEINFEARRGWFVDHVASSIARGAALRVGFAADGAALGFVLIDPATGYLDQICVAATAWGSGAAEALLAEARRLSAVRIELDVNADNVRAVGFYRRQGFRTIGEGRNPRSGLATLKLEWRAGEGRP